MDLTVQIGGYTVQVHEADYHPCLTWPLRPFDRFLAPSISSPDIQVDVTVVSPLPELPTGRLKFDSSHGCWKLFESKTGLLFESLDPKILQPRVRACISDDYRSVRAWILPDLADGQVGWSPMQLFNPLIEVCFLSYLAREGGILLHASGLSFCEQGYVFTGPSGAGKSTIAEIFADRGATVLSDERVIVRMGNPGFVLFGTPWVGSGQYAANALAPMTALYCIQHGRERHRIDLLKPSTVVTRMLQQAFLPHWDRSGVATTLEVLTSLTTTMPCRGLAFLNQLDIVDFLLDRSSELHTTVL
ncbi:MAG: hypothetical protein Nkreftii_001319 [Candidatus Nitrospira kreftii]|uniref:HPr kinase n=1 Tax=Candidatus Nitrospira kreftii TaxID=2652173 RepID=A0A7S8FCU8_9BACT|nr:MAG: hypothetical protein Nkreftii_001319 [Candidatus Nitrospira kreftii]